MEASTFVGKLLAAETHLQLLVKSVPDAPFEILTLANDVANLNLIISSVGRQGLDPEQRLLVWGILKSNGSQIKTLRELVEEMYRVYKESDFKSKRRRWIRHRGNVVTVLQEMRDLRISLAAAISTVVLSIIQSSELKLERIISSELDTIELQTPIALDNKAGTQQLYIYQQPQIALADLTASLKQDTFYLGLVFAVCEATQCIYRCRCVCHSWEEDTPTPFLNSLMGALLTAHCKSPLRYTKCSLSTCRRSSPTAEKVVYFFPPKVIPKMISIVHMMSSRGDPSVGLMPRRIVPQDSLEIVLASKGDIKGLQKLISERKVDLRSVVGAWGDSPLSNAVSMDHPEMTRFLLRQGVDPYLENAFGITANDIVWGKVLGKTIDSKIADEFAVLFADSFDADEMGFTILHKIVLNLTFRDLRTELETMSTPIDAQDDVGTTALNWAALRGDMPKITTLLEFGADPNVTCYDGVSPLHNASTYLGSIDPMLTLLEAGADVQALSSRGYTAVHFATAYRAPKKYVENLLARGIDMNHRSIDGLTHTMVAVRNNTAVLRYLLDLGADAEIGTYQDGFATPLIRAIRYNKHVPLKMLLEHGVCHWRVSGKGDTILHVAAEWGDVETMDILREASLSRLDIAAKTMEGLTPRMVFERRSIIEEEERVAFERLLDTIGDADENDSLEFVDAVECLSLAEE